MKIRTERVISVQDWDKTVEKTYKRKYSFQQQDGCKDRGNFYLTVPSPADDYENTTCPEEVNHKKMGVSFAAWLARDPKQPLNNEKEIDGSDKGAEQWRIDMWWERNFYPDVQMIANDLHEKGVLPAGEYTINIDW